MFHSFLGQGSPVLHSPQGKGVMFSKPLFPKPSGEGGTSHPVSALSALFLVLTQSMPFSAMSCIPVILVSPQ